MRNAIKIKCIKDLVGDYKDTKDILAFKKDELYDAIQTNGNYQIFVDNGCYNMCFDIAEDYLKEHFKLTDMEVVIPDNTIFKFGIQD